MLLQMIVLLAVFLVIRKAARSMREDLEDLRSSIAPIIYNTRDLLTRLTPKIEETTSDLAALTHSLRTQAADVQSAANEIVDRVRRQARPYRHHAVQCPRRRRARRRLHGRHRSQAHAPTFRCPGLRQGGRRVAAHGGSCGGPFAIKSGERRQRYVCIGRFHKLLYPPWVPYSGTRVDAPRKHVSRMAFSPRKSHLSRLYARAHLLWFRSRSLAFGDLG